MKSIIALLVLISTQAYAIDLTCTLNYGLQTNTEWIHRVTFWHIEAQGDVTAEGALKSTLPDQNTLTPFEPNRNVYTATFSNECDNMYEISFPADTFRAILSYHADFVIGTLSYENADSQRSSVTMNCGAF